MALNNTQYEAIMRGYERTRDRNRRLLDSRRAKAYRAVPLLEELERSVGRTAAEQVRLLLSGEEGALERALASLHDISARRSRLLSEAGFAPDYLEPVYDCPHCQDTGYIRQEDGTSRKCHCLRRQEIALLYEQSNIQDMISRENFSTLSYEYYQGEDLAHFQRAVKICRDFVQNFKQDYHNIFFYGTVGVGKSFLSGCIARELIQQEYSTIYLGASGLFDTLARYSFNVKEKENLAGFYSDLYNCDLLILDDLGTEVTNSFVTSQLFACLNERLLRKHPTIISTNLSLEDLRDRYSDRVFSRITSNYTLCKLTGPDIRMYKRRTANAANINPSAPNS